MVKRFSVFALLAAVALFSLNADARGHGGGGKAAAPRTHAAPTSTPRAAPKASAPKARAPKVSATKAAPRGATPSAAPVHVKPSVRKSTGTVVPAHERTAPNKTEKDNWSSKPNTNPTTGVAGTKTTTK